MNPSESYGDVKAILAFFYTGSDDATAASVVVESKEASSIPVGDVASGGLHTADESEIEKGHAAGDELHTEQEALQPDAIEQVPNTTHSAIPAETQLAIVKALESDLPELEEELPPVPKGPADRPHRRQATRRLASVIVPQI